MQKRLCKGTLHLTILTGYLRWYYRSITQKLVLLFFSHSVVSDCFAASLQPARLLCPWDFPGKKPGEGCLILLQSIFPTQGSNPHLLHWQADFLPLSHQETPHKKFMNNKVQPYSTGNYIQYPVTQYTGKECVCVYTCF